MNVNELKVSKYLKKEDCGPNGVLVTIERIEQENVAKEGAEPDMKYVMYFQESEKGTVLNSTNGQSIAKILGSEESDAWIGKRIVLYNDPNVSYAGRITGGIRVRAPKIKKPISAPPPSAPVAKKKVINTDADDPSEACDETGEPIESSDGMP